MAMLAERERLERERHLHELELQQKQLSYLLERCNSFATQSTLVCGFAFTAFSAEALANLDYVKAPIRSFSFVLSGATTMALSISAVGTSAYLTSTAERIAMEADVKTAVALVRWRMNWVIVPYYVSLMLLWMSATLLVFTTCKVEGGDEEFLCTLNGWFVCLIFFILGGSVMAYPVYRIKHDAHRIYTATGAEAVRWSENGAGAQLGRWSNERPSSEGALQAGEVVMRDPDLAKPGVVE